MINIAVCDDSARDLNDVLGQLRKYQALHKDIKIRAHSFLGGIDLVDLIQDGKTFDVFLIDVIMPDINGVNLARLIRHHNDQASVILMSGSPAYLRKMRGTGEIAYLEKPVQEDGIFSKLDKIIDAKKSVQSAVTE